MKVIFSSEMEWEEIFWQLIETPLTMGDARRVANEVFSSLKDGAGYVEVNFSNGYAHVGKGSVELSETTGEIREWMIALGIEDFNIHEP